MDELTKGQENIAEKLAALLADSPIDENIKTDLIENLDTMPMHHLVQLLGFLIDQNKEFSALEADINALVKQHKAEWEALEAQQATTATSMVDAAVAAATAESELEANLTE